MVNQFFGFFAFIGIPTGSEWWIILLVVVLLFGAKKLPELARGIGRSVGEFRKAKSEFDREMEQAIRDDESTSQQAKAEADKKASPAGTTPASFDKN